MEELTRSETARRLNMDNAPGKDERANLEALVDNLLDPVREAFGRPLHVNSGYRCPRLNKAVGGAASSQHIRGQAADLDARDGRENRRLFTLIEENFDFDQLIWENGGAWVHVSYRSDGKNRRQVKRLWKR